MELSCEEERVSAGRGTSGGFESLNTRLRRYASMQAFGCDLDPSLIRASQVGRVETIAVLSRKVARKFPRKKRMEDNDLPEIAERCDAFRREHPEPGA